MSLSIDDRKEAHTYSKEVNLVSLRRKLLSTLLKEIINTIKIDSIHSFIRFEKA